MKDNSKFSKGSGCYECEECGKLTRSTGRGDNEKLGLCVSCYELNEKENSQEVA
jgi:hypothetical protein